MMKPYARVLWMLLVASWAVAQEPADPEATTAADEAATEESRPAEPALESEPPDASEGSGSPFEYQASEQISEDLSVSFPVDI